MENNLYYFDDETKRAQFMKDLKIPFAGSRIYSTARVSNEGYTSNLWSSSPVDDYAHYLYINSSDVRAYSSFYRAYGLSIRCFKDTYS
jgi:hypothetical protein